MSYRRNHGEPSPFRAGSSYVSRKIEHSKGIIRNAVEAYKRIAVACSFGKDSMVLVHLARQVKPDIKVFTVMTPFKPKETLKYKDRMIKRWNLNIKEYLDRKSVV